MSRNMNPNMNEFRNDGTLENGEEIMCENTY